MLASCIDGTAIENIDSEETYISRSSDGRVTSGSDALVGDWQIPFCAGSGNPDFRTTTIEMVGLRLFADGTYEAQRPARQLGQPCGPSVGCVGLEVGTYAVRVPIDARGISLGDRLVLRPADGTPREYVVTRGTTLQLSKPTLVVAADATPGAQVTLYPRPLLRAPQCHNCADTQSRVRRVVDGTESWTCVDGAGMYPLHEPV
jgi:hypothetical protein